MKNLNGNDPEFKLYTLASGEEDFKRPLILTLSNQDHPVRSRQRVNEDADFPSLDSIIWSRDEMFFLAHFSTSNMLQLFARQSSTNFSKFEQ